MSLVQQVPTAIMVSPRQQCLWKAERMYGNGILVFQTKKLAYSERSTLRPDDFLKAADWTRPWLADPLELEGVRSVGAVK
jgi:hypothetical protein